MKKHHTPANRDKFNELVREFIPIKNQSDAIQLQMVKLSLDTTLEIVTTAFPQAQVITMQPLSEIKPSDYAKNATEAVRLMQENNLTPTLIVVDTARMIVTLAKHPDLPPAAKSKARQAKGNAR